MGVLPAISPLAFTMDTEAKSMTDTDTPRTTAPAMEGDALTAEQIAAIEERLTATPGGDWHSALGSGHNAMTAVMADIPDGEDDYESVFICDVIPDYRVEDPQVWENRVPLLAFISNAPTDIATLLTSHADLRDRLARAEERERAREYENSKQRDMLAEAIIQLGGTLTVMPQILMMRRDWIMTGPERRQPDGAYVWRVHRTTPTDGAAPPRRSGEREGDD
jgi:hypothetical protein